AAVVNHEPPTHSTFGRCRNCGAVCTLMPPVGQKRTSANGPAQADSNGAPPACTAGKNLNVSRPCSSPCISSDEVATPGRNGRSTSRAAAYRRSVAPGDTAKRPPASFTACICAEVSTVPAPITASGTASAMALTASIARGVRRVTSITGRPPRNSACATCTASSTSSGVNTGITGASFSTARTRGSAPDIESLLAHQGQYVSFADRIEVAGDGVFQAPGGQAETHGGVGVEAAHDAMQDAGGEGIASADAIDDALQLAY